MTTAQKVIKYLANAFAIFLIVTIISSVLNIGYDILSAIGAITTKENKILDDFITISDNTEEVSSLKLDTKGLDLQIKNGERLEVKTNNSNVKYSSENGNIVIKEEKQNTWDFEKSYEGTIIIYLPEYMEQIDEVKMDIGAGTVSIETLNTQSLYLDLGAGNITIDNIIVSKETKINGGAGNISINSGKVSNLDLDLGIGKTNIKADVTGKSKIDTGVGNLDLYLTLSKEDYKIDIDKGIGEIKFNDNTIEDNTSFGEGSNYIKINGGVGEININTEQFL